MGEKMEMVSNVLRYEVLACKESLKRVVAVQALTPTPEPDYPHRFC
jgi:hypothetical protein